MKKSLLKYASLVLLGFSSFSFAQAQGNVAINTDNSNANNSAVLDIKATNKGMLIPRMTDAEKTAIVAPATGLLVFQTDGTSGFYFYNGTNWDPLAGIAETASNGLTKAGNNIKLGGSAGSTIITHDNHTLTHDLTANRNYIIAASGTNYFLFLNDGTISYIDGGQALGKVLTSDANGKALWKNAPILGTTETASNGLNKVGNDIQLGGPLTIISIIDQVDFDLKFDLTGSGDINVKDNGTTFFTFQDNGKIRYIDGNQALGKVLTVTDPFGVATWQTPVVPSITETASNGLVKVSNDTRLGGTLTGNSSIDHDASTLNFNLTGTGDINVQDNGVPFFIFRDDKRIVYTDGNQAVGKVFTSDATGIGTWQVPPSGSTETASNGLVKVGNDIRLGSTLTAATTVWQGADHLTFNLTGTGDFMMLANGGTAIPILNVVNNGSLIHNNLGAINSTINLKSTGNFKVLVNGGSANPILNVNSDGSITHNNLGAAHSIIDLKSTGNFKVLKNGNANPILNVVSDGSIVHNNLSTSSSSIDLTSTGNFVIEENGNAFATFSNLGNVNFGGPSYPNVKFSAGYDATGTGRIATFVNVANATTADGISINAGSTTAAGASLVTFARGGTNTIIGEVIQNTASTVNYATTSDKRLKENIHPTQFGLADLLKIGVYDYNYITDPSKQTCTGYLAQDLYEIYPEAVSKPQDENADPEEDPWMIDYGKITPLIIKSVQEQQAQIEVLKQETAAIKAQFSEVAELKADMAEIKVLLNASASANK